MLNRTGTDQIDNEILLLGGITDRKLGVLRLILAAGALLIIYIDPTEPNRYLGITYIAVIAFTSYSLLLYLAARRQTNFTVPVVTRFIWIDIAWATALISMSSGTSSAFYFFYFFEIIVACSRRGRRLGMAVTVVSAILCVSVGLFAPTRGEFELNRFLLRPLTIIALGYTLAYWGGTEIVLKKKLLLLKELSTVANPRFGVDRTIDQMLTRLLKFYDADHCVLLLDEVTDEHLYRAMSPSIPEASLNSNAEGEIRTFLIQSPSSAALYSNLDSSGNRVATYKLFDPISNNVTTADPGPAVALAGFLAAKSMIAVTCPYRERIRGRLLLSSSQADAFDIGDAAFLLQVANQVLPLIENIRLVDRLASNASEAERQRLARSVHDRVIQPYYGLQIGLKALQGILESEERSRSITNEHSHHTGKPELLLEQLMTMTTEGINELREYVYGLKQVPAGETRLADSIRRYAGKFEGATGIHVDVNGGSDGLAASDRLTSEVFQMTTEALSNIHRHTRSRSAQVSLNLESNNLILQVENETDRDSGPVPFNPSSISERADALGGSAEVLWREGRTILKVEVPL